MNKRLISAIVAMAMTVSFIPVSFAEKMNDDIEIENEEIIISETTADDIIVDEYTYFEQDFDDTENEIYEDEVNTEEASVRLMANTGTYYDEWGIYFDSDTGTITDCNWTGKELSLPSEIDGTTVSTIGYGAFQGLTSLEKITIPKTVENTGRTLIGYNYYYGNWFRGCTNLTTVIFEEGATQIPSYALASATAVDKINIPDSVTSIENYAFDSCSSLKQIQLPENLTTIGYGAFQSCNSLENITIPKNVTETGRALIGYNYSYGNWFNDCSNLKSIVIEEGVENIPNFAFANTPALETVSLPNSLTKIGYKAFADCPKLNNVRIPANVNSTGSALSSSNYVYGNWFYGCNNLKSVTISNGVTTIPQYAFEYIPALETVIMSNTVTQIEHHAFKDCVKLKNITLSKSLTTIGYSCFLNCSSLSEIIIPASVKETGRYISGGGYVYGNWFNRCSNLKSIVIEEGAENIPNFAFANTPALETVSLPNSLTKIGYKAFADCPKLNNVRIPANVNATGNTLSSSDYVYGNWFYGCGSLHTITICDGVETIPQNAFEGISELYTVVMADSIMDIGNYAFKDCTKLKNINLSKALTSIGYQAFQNCSSLETIKIPASISKSGRIILGVFGYQYGRWFNGCTNLKTVVIEEGMETIPNSAFGDIPNKINITVPDSITTIEKMRL